MFSWCITELLASSGGRGCVVSTPIFHSLARKVRVDHKSKGGFASRSGNFVAKRRDMSGESKGTEKKKNKLPKFSWEEVAKHNSAESLWLVVHDKVYDITSFTDEVKLKSCWLCSFEPVFPLFSFLVAPWWGGSIAGDGR